MNIKSVYQNIKTGSRQRLHLRSKESLRDGNNTLGELFLRDSFQTGTAHLPEPVVIIFRNPLLAAPFPDSDPFRTVLAVADLFHPLFQAALLSNK